MTTQELSKYIQDRPGIANDKIRANLYKAHGVNSEQISQARALIGGTSVAFKMKPGAMTRSEFKSKFDHDTRTREAIKRGINTIMGPDEIVDDASFRSRCGAGTPGWRLVASEQQFRKYQWQTNGKVFWGHPTTKAWALREVQGSVELT